MELGEAALCEERGGKADGLWVAIEELKEGVFAYFSDLFTV